MKTNISQSDFNFCLLCHRRNAINLDFEYLLFSLSLLSLPVTLHFCVSIPYASLCQQLIFKIYRSSIYQTILFKFISLYMYLSNSFSFYPYNMYQSNSILFIYLIVSLHLIIYLSVKLYSFYLFNLIYPCLLFFLSM